MWAWYLTFCFTGVGVRIEDSVLGCAVHFFSINLQRGKSCNISRHFFIRATEGKDHSTWTLQKSQPRTAFIPGLRENELRAIIVQQMLIPRARFNCDQGGICWIIYYTHMYVYLPHRARRQTRRKTSFWIPISNSATNSIQQWLRDENWPGICTTFLNAD